MPELTLLRAEPGRYTLGDLGTLTSGRRFAAELEAGGTTWRVRRAPMTFGAVIQATDEATGELAARYLPTGFLRLRGIYRGTVALGDRELDWRADQYMGEHFTLSESGSALGVFDAGSDAEPVTVTLYGLSHLEALPLLFCCYLAKRVVDTSMEVGKLGPPAATPGR